ncbi:MAG TPA: cytochrome c [Candidatus Sulfotelmatobacter sp.]|nr:cytochrome c [Candidatus Sulfotelmatobacter sp.]
MKKRKNQVMKTAVAGLLSMLVLGSSLFAGAPSGRKEATSVAAVVRYTDADSMRLQGEQRFRANCGRCHAAPQKFPPRMMATVIRHMRVRATITDQDMRLVLVYMTQ